MEGGGEITDIEGEEVGIFGSTAVFGVDDGDFAIRDEVGGEGKGGIGLPLPLGPAMASLSLLSYLTALVNMELLLLGWLINV